MATEERRPRELTALHARNFDYKKQVPAITLSGLWLKEFGFKPGDKVQVTSAEDGKLTITRISSAQ